MATTKPQPQTAKASAFHERTLPIPVGRSPRLMDFGSVQIAVVDLGYAAARDKLADVIRAAVGQGIKFHIGNERNPMADTVVLMAPGELGKLVDPALRERVDVIRAAVDQGMKAQLGNERNVMADTVVLMAPGELGKLVDPALRERKRKGAEILSGMPFAGTGLPTLRLTAHDNDTQVLRVPATARDRAV